MNYPKEGETTDYVTNKDLVKVYKFSNIFSSHRYVS